MADFNVTLTTDNFLATANEEQLNAKVKLEDGQKLSAKFSSEQPFNVSMSGNDSMTVSLGEVQKVSTSNYEELYNRPRIEGNEVIGDKTFVELGLSEITMQEIDEIIYGR